MKKDMRIRLGTSSPLVLVVFLIALMAIGTVSLFAGDSYALDNLSIRQVTPDQVANAMHDDSFYSTYRENTLFIHGAVSSVTESGHSEVVDFTTHGSFLARCQMQENAPTVYAGSTITLVTEAYVAERQPSAVLLRGCVLSGNA